MVIGRTETISIKLTPEELRAVDQAVEEKQLHTVGRTVTRAEIVRELFKYLRRDNAKKARR